MPQRAAFLRMLLLVATVRAIPLLAILAPYTDAIVLAGVWFKMLQTTQPVVPVRILAFSL